MLTCKRLDLETLEYQPIMPKNLPVSTLSVSRTRWNNFHPKYIHITESTTFKVLK